MAARVLRIRYQISIDDLSWPIETITLDAVGRVGTMRYQYPSICASYTMAWVGDTTEVEGHTQVISDGVCPIVDPILASDYAVNEAYAVRGDDLTGVVDSKEFTLIMWIKFNELSDGVHQQVISTNASGGASTISLARLSTGRFSFSAKDLSNTTSLSFQITNDLPYDSTKGWIPLFISADNSISRLQVYIGDVDSVPGSFNQQDELIDLHDGNFSIFSNTSGSQNVLACLSSMLFHTTSIDLSDEAIRRKLIDASGNAVNFGDGTTIFGEPALIAAQDGDLSNNNGSGGNFTITNELTSCGDAP